MILVARQEESGAKTLATHPLLSSISTVYDLDSADVAFAGNGLNGTLQHGVELKSITDLLQSIGSGRLQGQGGQLQRMLKVYDVCWLLYYGDVKAAFVDDKFPRLQVMRGNKWVIGKRPYAYLMSFLSGLTDAGIRVVHVYDKESAVAWIRSTYNRYSKPWGDHKLFNVLQQPPEAKKKSRNMIDSLLPDRLEEGLGVEGRQIMKTMASFTNISYDRALSIARHFRSIRAIMSATEDEIIQIPGIGKGIARQLIKEIGQERK